MEWIIIVRVAIVSGCLLAANNPSTSAGIVGASHEAISQPDHLQRTPTIEAFHHPNGPPQRDRLEGHWKRFSRNILGWSDAYETVFQPVSLWSRWTNKMKWIRKSQAWKQDKQFKEEMKITCWGWFFKILLPALALVALPPATGGVSKSVLLLSPKHVFFLTLPSFLIHPENANPALFTPGNVKIKRY